MLCVFVAFIFCYAFVYAMVFLYPYYFPQSVHSSNLHSLLQETLLPTFYNLFMVLFSPRLFSSPYSLMHMIPNSGSSWNPLEKWSYFSESQVYTTHVKGPQPTPNQVYSNFNPLLFPLNSSPFLLSPQSRKLEILE